MLSMGLTIKTFIRLSEDRAGWLSGCCTDRASGAPTSLSRCRALPLPCGLEIIALQKMETVKQYRVAVLTVSLTGEVGGAAAGFLGFSSARLSDRGGASQMETSEICLSHFLFVK